jgi:streptogramin lyase
MKSSMLLKVLALLILILFQGCESENVEPSTEDPAKEKEPSTGRLSISPIPGNIVTIAGINPHSAGYTGDGGLATAATLAWITNLAVDISGNVYISDGASNTIRKVDASTGNISTIAGVFVGFNVVDPTPFAGDGGPAVSAHLNVPLSVDVDESENVIILDAANFVIRRITSSDGKIQTIAGNGQMGYTGDNGPATSASFDNPYNIAFDHDGNIYVAEVMNNVVRRVDKTTGEITTIAGSGPGTEGYSGDNGPAAYAQLNRPDGIAVDHDGNIYISDGENYVIRKISGGTITTIAGTGEAGYSGDGGDAMEAQFYGVKGIAVDADGNIFIADTGNNAIRKITKATGIISTIAGGGPLGYSGDGGPASAAKLSNPLDVDVDVEGNIYIADTGNFVIRVITH